MKREELIGELAEKMLATFLGMIRDKPRAFFRVPEDEPNAIECGFQTDVGIVKMRFYPNKTFSTWAQGQAQILVDGMLDGYTLKSQYGSVVLRDAENKEVAKEWVEPLAASLMVSFFEALSINLAASLKSTTDDAVALTLQKIQRGMLREAIETIEGIRSIETNGVEEQWAEANARATRNREEAFAVVLKQISHEARLDQIATYYEELYPIWRDALKIFQSNDNADWRGMVRLKYQGVKIAAHDLRFDDVLLARLAGELDKVSEVLQTRINEQGGDHTPGTIAIEHAARLCGAYPYQFHVSKLLRERRNNEESGE
jgi:hypothetical protein